MEVLLLKVLKVLLLKLHVCALCKQDEKRRRDLMNSLEDYFKSHFEIERVIRDEAGLSEVPSREQPSSGIVIQFVTFVYFSDRQWHSQ